MPTSTWVKVIGCLLLVGGCSSSNDSPPAAGGGGGGGVSADAFTNSVAQTAGAKTEDQEPSDQLAQMAATTPENTEPDNL